MICFLCFTLLFSESFFAYGNTFGVVYLVNHGHRGNSVYEADLEISGAPYRLHVKKKGELPSGAQFRAVIPEADTAAYEEAALGMVEKNQGEVGTANLLGFLEMGLYVDGACVEPDGDVEIGVIFPEEIEGEVYVVHFPGTGEGSLPVVEDKPLLVEEDLAAKEEELVFFQGAKEDFLEEEDEVAGELMAAPELIATTDDGNTASFTATSFSYYAIISYTVDFHYGEYEFSIPGGGYVTLSELFKRLSIDLDVADVAMARFGTPSLVWAGKAEETLSVGKIKEQNALRCEYSAELTEEKIKEINAAVVEAGDWVLIDLKAFDTKERLTITCKDGKEIVIQVTDAGDGLLVDSPDGTGKIVQTIHNPSGTTPTMFDYWIDVESLIGRAAWPGFKRNQHDGYHSGWYNYFSSPVNFSTNGNNIGINKDHKLKFSPSHAGDLYDYKVTTGEYIGVSQDGRVEGINSWNGNNNKNGTPTTGIVAGALYDASGTVLDTKGYPRLNLNGGEGDGNAESLAYLFDPSYEHSGKKSYTKADDLFYVDKEGYYKYESLDYSAAMDKDTHLFTVKEHTRGANDPDTILGFWPMGDWNYWFGMHLKAEFSVPINGEVLNPRGEYKPMKFEFAGDDDAWAYIDGILVADGGGIHNRTELDIDYQTGIVYVKGGEYTDASNPNTTVISQKTIYEIFVEAHNQKLIPDEKWDTDYTNTPEKTVWIDADGDGTYDTFAPGTYHKFDFYYLERGGGESNLYIKYNMVATEDFTAHKAVSGMEEEERLARDRYRFEMIGLGDEYEIGAEGIRSVIMPKTGWVVNEEMAIVGLKNENHEGPGSFENPKMVYQADAYTDAEGNVLGGYIYSTGNTDNGDVRFGMADIDPDLLKLDPDPYEHKYIIREIVPEDAVNIAGIQWKDATAQQKEAGGFVKDNIMYDGRTYYMMGEVTTWGDEDELYGLTKTYYKDDSFTQVDSEVSFVDFRNAFIPDCGIVEVKKVNENNQPLPGATFTLFTNQGCTAVAKDIYGEDLVVTTTEDGEVSFAYVPVGTYYMKETHVPNGYPANDTVYIVQIEDFTDLSKHSSVKQNGTEIKKLANTHAGEISVVKEWVDAEGNPVEGEEDITVQLKRKKSTEHTVNLHFHSNSYPAGPGYAAGDAIDHDKNGYKVYGDTVTITYPDITKGTGRTTSAVDPEILVSSNGNVAVTSQSINNTRTITISPVTADLDVTISYNSNNYDLKQKWSTIEPSIRVSGNGTGPAMAEDASFPSGEEKERATAVLSVENDYAAKWTLGMNGDFPLMDDGGSYLYYVEEWIHGKKADGDTLVRIENNEGISEGLITVVNTKREDDGAYEPEAEPKARKKVTSNEDGTYTLKLSVTMPEGGSAGKANFVIVLDSSNSMNEKGSALAKYVPDPEHGSYIYDENHDPFAGPDYADYFPLVAYEKTDGSIVYYISVPDTNGGTRPKQIVLQNWSNSRYRLEPTRQDVAKDCVEYLGKKLTDLNTEESPDAIELAFVEFGTIVKQQTQPTTSYEAFSAWVDACDNYARSFPNAAHLYGATNWEAALNAANSIDFQDDDPIFIVFVSDGDPTARQTEVASDDGIRIGLKPNVLGMVPGAIDGVYGEGNSDTKGYNFDCAKIVAEEILASGKYLYNVGIYNDIEKMECLPGNLYQEGSDEDSIKKAFDDIADAFYREVSFQNVRIEDGITGLSSSSFIQGHEPIDFVYDVRKIDEDDPSKSVSMMETMSEEQKAALHATWTVSPSEGEAGQIQWLLGDNLIPGATYSLTCILWPSQEAYDLVAELNNGRDYSSLSDAQRSQVIQNQDGTYELKTNTFVDSACTKVEKMGNEDPVVTENYAIPVKETLTNMPLKDTMVNIRKKWNAGLDKSMLQTIKNFTAKLKLYRNGQAYLSDSIEISAPRPILVPAGFAWVWPETYVWHNEETNQDETVLKYRYISAGLIVTEEGKAWVKKDEEEEGQDGVDLSKYPSVTYRNNGESVRYYILEEGWDYSFREEELAENFELEENVFHPMVVDGHLYDVKFEVDEHGSRTITEMKPASGNTVNLTAENILKSTPDLVIQKTDETGEVYLENAVFEIYRKNDTSWIKLTKEDLSSLDTEGRFTVPKSGFQIEGISEGSYKLSEVAAPDGYVIQTKEPVFFTVSGGKSVKEEGTSRTVTYHPAEGTALASFSIPNEPGAALPATGGSGAIPFYVWGVALTLLGGVTIFLRKREQEGC